MFKARSAVQGSMQRSCVQELHGSGSMSFGRSMHLRCGSMLRSSVQGSKGTMCRSKQQSCGSMSFGRSMRRSAVQSSGAAGKATWSRFKAAKLRFNALKRGSMQRSCGSFSDKLRKRQSRAQCPSDVQCAKARGRPDGG